MLNCRVPTFRSDITREIDIVEEIGRVFGYDKLEMTLPEGSSQGKDSPEGIFSEKLRRYLMSCGAQEALTHSIVESALAASRGQECERVIIRNPLTEDLDSMRVALTPNLLQVVASNQAYRNGGCQCLRDRQGLLREAGGGISREAVGWRGDDREPLAERVGAAGEGAGCRFLRVQGACGEPAGRSRDTRGELRWSRKSAAASDQGGQDYGRRQGNGMLGEVAPEVVEASGRSREAVCI